MSEPLIEINNLKKYFWADSGWFSGRREPIRAVDGVDLQIPVGQTVGLVGESGCGKTTLGRCLLGLTKPTTGNIVFSGKDIFQLTAHQMRRLREQMQIIFQDPYASLNPRMTVQQIIAEPLQIHHLGVPRDRQAVVEELLERVELQPECGSRYPHQLSGGQRQRVAIARALASQPKFIVADEPVSALDTSTQAQILNLMKDLQAEQDLTYLFIAHDMPTVRYMSDLIAVMYRGRIVEWGPAPAIFGHPTHPYTHLLLSASRTLQGLQPTQQV